MSLSFLCLKGQIRVIKVCYVAAWWKYASLNAAAGWSWCEDLRSHCVVTQIRELEPILCHDDRCSQVIWTSSSNAHRSAFTVKDMQHQGGTQPYSSSKYASDLLSLALNTHYNDKVGSCMHELVLTILMSVDAIAPFSPPHPQPPHHLGVVLVCHLSGICDDQSDLWHPALFPGIPLDAAHAHLLAGE